MDVENVYKRIRKTGSCLRISNALPLEVVYDASREVRIADLELYLDYRGELRALVLLGVVWKAVCWFRWVSLYRGVVCFYGGGAYLDPGAL